MYARCMWAILWVQNPTWVIQSTTASCVGALPIRLSVPIRLALFTWRWDFLARAAILSDAFPAHPAPLCSPLFQLQLIAKLTLHYSKKKTLSKLPSWIYFLLSSVQCILGFAYLRWICGTVFDSGLKLNILGGSVIKMSIFKKSLRTGKAKDSENSPLSRFYGKTISVTFIPSANVKHSQHRGFTLNQ